MITKTYERIRSPLDAIEHLTDCTLATVHSMVIKACPSPGELRRQIQIAQAGINQLEIWGPQDPEYRPAGRVARIFARPDRSVIGYAAELRAQKHPDKPIRIR